MASSLAEQTSLESLGDGRYESRFRPQPMGNNQPIAYGGCTIGIAVRAACETVPANLHLYSAQGNFLGPSQLDRKYIIRVQDYRTTRSFATRHVEVSQKQDTGQLRRCMVVLADFHVAEERSMLDYTSKPTQRYNSFADCKSTEQVRHDLVERGQLSLAQAEAHSKGFSLAGRMWETRHCPESVGAQNLMGIAKHAPTTQDDRDVAEKTTAQWFRSSAPLNGEAEQLSSLAFILDAAVAFLPLSHSRMYLDDAGACSTLDFSLRLFANSIDVNDWNLRELRTNAGGCARTFSECRVWNQQGKMVASMTQQSILRPKL